MLQLQPLALSHSASDSGDYELLSTAFVLRFEEVFFWEGFPLKDAWNKQVCIILLLVNLFQQHRYGVVAQRVMRWTCDQYVAGLKSNILLGATLRNKLGQVVHTYVPLSPSSITW